MAKYFDRVRAILCAAWHISPLQLNIEIDKGLPFVDVINAILLYGSTCQFNVKRFIFLEEEMAKEKEVENVRHLAGILNSTKDPVKRKEIIAQINKIQGINNG